MQNKIPSRRNFLRNISLASVSLGVSSHVVASVSHKSKNLVDLTDCDPTTLDFYGPGPFYTPNAPLLIGNQLAPASEPGDRVLISGRVTTLNCEEFIGHTLIDIWHANDSGAYDNQGFHLRGTTRSNAQGFYLFETILPGKYLNGGQFRPSHIHFKISPPNHPTLTTQLYFEGDTSIPTDAAASITTGIYDASNRIIPLTVNLDGNFEGTWDIIVDGDGDGHVGIGDIHLDKGMIYTVSPNPFSDTLEIRYGVFNTANVGIKVFNLNGELISILSSSRLTPEKYTAAWAPESSTPNGHYFVVLQINDIQAHYIKVILARG